MEEANLVRNTGGLYPAPQKNWNGRTWPKQGNVISAGSKNPIIVQAKVENDFVIKLKAPDLERSDFTIDFESGRLKISVGQNGKSTDDLANTHFERVFRLPENFDANRPSISFEEGVLNIAVPRKE